MQELFHDAVNLAPMPYGGLETTSPLADDRQLLGFAVPEQFGPECYFLGTHRLGRDHVGEIALGTAGLEVHAYAIRGRLRVCDDFAL